MTGDTYNMSIGQGDVLSTPLQVTQMTAVVANDGYLYRPQLIEAITDSESQLVQRMQPDLIREIPVRSQSSGHSARRHVDGRQLGTWHGERCRPARCNRRR